MWGTRMGKAKEGEQTSSRSFFRAVEWELLATGSGRRGGPLRAQLSPATTTEDSLLCPSTSALGSLAIGHSLKKLLGSVYGDFLLLADFCMHCPPLQALIAFLALPLLFTTPV